MSKIKGYGKIQRLRLFFTRSKSDLKWPIYDLNGNIIASHSIPGRLASG